MVDSADSSTRSATPAHRWRRWGAAVDADVQVQAVVRQQHASWRAISPWKPTNCAGFFRPRRWPLVSVTARFRVDHAVGGRVEVRALLQRHAAVQHMARVFDDLGAAHRL